MKIIADNSFLKISKQEKEKFYKKQFEYYKGFNTGIITISVSLGICEYGYNSYKATVNKADKALYKAKELGRNRTVKYSSIRK